MQAWLLPNFSGISSTHLAETPDPIPASGEALINLHYAALNPADAYLAQGQYPARPALPHILGRDGMGTIISVPASPGTENKFKLGQKVLLLRSAELGSSRPGTFAQKVAVPLDALAPIPAGWSDAESAAASLVYLTAYQALTQWTDLSKNPQVILITGASGGVGVASVQLASALGHTVIGLSRSAEKSQKLLTLGAHATFDPADPLWPKKLRAFLNPQDPQTKSGKKVNLAIDNIGGILLPDVIDTLAMNGRVSLVGRLAGPVPNFNTASLFFRRLRLGGVAVGTYTHEETHAAWQHILQLMSAINAKPSIDKIFPFQDLQAAFTRLAAGPMGKVLLQIQ